MKLLSLLALLLFLPAMAHGEERSFEKFRITVPESWVYTNTYNLHSFLSPDLYCAVSVAVDHAQGGNPQDVAASLADNLKADPPVEENGDYVFHFENAKGVRSVSRFRQHGEDFVLVTASGSCPALAGVLSSVTLLTPGNAALPLAPAPPR